MSRGKLETVNQSGESKLPPTQSLRASKPSECIELPLEAKYSDQSQIAAGVMIDDS